MAGIRDLYQILGVSNDASAEDIKKAYRQLARELHPDVSADPSTEVRFKEVTAAYEILSDPAKRQQYDRYGGSGGGGEMPFGDVADLFEAFFGGGGFGTRRRPARRTRTRRGDDIFAAASLTFHEAAFGAHRELQVERMRTCERCTGTGAAPGSVPTRCRTCGGSGQMQDVRRSIFGTVMTAHPCIACEGTGEEIVDRCSDCGGDGRVPRSDVVTVEVPPGVSDGLELRVQSAGHAGRAGGSPGDLYLSLQVSDDPIFERRGQDVFAVLEVPMVQASLGAQLDVETLDGVERVELDPGTESGTVVRLRGQGVPNLGRRGRGDLFLTIQVQTPKDLNKVERELLEELAKLRGEAAGKRAVVRAALRRPS
jgi:molecular chaperone DnaJ